MFRLAPGTDLMLLAKGTGNSFVAINGNAGAVMTPSKTLDGKSVLYSYCSEITGGPPSNGNCSLWSFSVANGSATQITFPEAGFVDLSPMQVPNGDILFVSNRKGWRRLKVDAGTDISLQVYKIDKNGVVNDFWPAPGTIVDLMLTPHGRVGMNVLQNMSEGDSRRWSVSGVNQDGSNFGAIVFGMRDPLHPWHKCTGTNRSSIVCIPYYILSNYGAGGILEFPEFPTGNPPSGPRFGPVEARLNPKISAGPGFIPWQFSHTPVGTHPLAPAAWFDRPAGVFSDGVYTGKYRDVEWAPDGVLVSWSGGPVHKAETPLPHFGIYLIQDGAPINRPEELIPVIPPQDGYNLAFPVAVVPWKAIHGQKPPRTPHVSNDGKIRDDLPVGTPFALIGGVALNYGQKEGGQTAWGWPGGMPPPYLDNEAVVSVGDWQGTLAVPKGTDIDRIYGIQFRYHSGVRDDGSVYNTSFWSAGGSQRVRLSRVFPVIKHDTDGNIMFTPWDDIDTSFLAKVPCNTSLDFCAVTKEGANLFCVDSWHVLRCGEIHTACGACHGPSIDPRDFSQCAASKPGFPVMDATESHPVPEFYEDIRPILEAKCISCHSGDTPAAMINFADQSQAGKPENPRDIGFLPKDAAVLIDNIRGQNGGYPLVAPMGMHRRSREVSFYALQSPLLWSLTGVRMDAIDNTMFATESIPGDASSLPLGWTKSSIDIDLRQETVDAHSQAGISNDDIMVFIQWLNGGTPIGSGWKNDSWLPIISTGKTKNNIFFGSFDIGSGLNIDSMSITRDNILQKPVAVPGNRWRVKREPGKYMMRISDNAGNTTESVIYEPQKGE